MLVRLGIYEEAVRRLEKEVCQKKMHPSDRVDGVSSLFDAYIEHPEFMDAMNVPCAFKGKPPTDADALNEWLAGEKSKLLDINKSGLGSVEKQMGWWVLPLHLYKGGQVVEAAATLALLHVAAKKTAHDLLDKASDITWSALDGKMSVSALRKAQKRARPLQDRAMALSGVDFRSTIRRLIAAGQEQAAAKTLDEMARADLDAMGDEDLESLVSKLLDQADQSSSKAVDPEFVDAAAEMGCTSPGKEKWAAMSVFSMVESPAVVTAVKGNCAEQFHSGNVMSLVFQKSCTADVLKEMLGSDDRECREQALYAIALRGDKELIEEVTALLEKEDDPVLQNAIHMALYELGAQQGGG
jgi:hypothetical protein